MKLLAKCEKIFDALLNIMATLAAVILILVVILVSVDSLGRYFFNITISWANEVSEYSLLYITFLGSPWLLRKEGHVMMEIITTRLSKPVRAIFGVISSLIGAVTYIFFLWFGTAVTIHYYQTGYFRPTNLELPLASIIAIIPIGSLFLLIQFCRRAMTFYKQWKNEKTPEVQNS